MAERFGVIPGGGPSAQGSLRGFIGDSETPQYPRRLEAYREKLELDE